MNKEAFLRGATEGLWLNLNGDMPKLTHDTWAGHPKAQSPSTPTPATAPVKPEAKPVPTS